MRDVSLKYFINDKKRNTFCIMLFIMLFLLSIISLAMSVYNYKIADSIDSLYYNLRIDLEKRNILDEDFINVSFCEDEGNVCIVSVSFDDGEKLTSLLFDNGINYSEYDNSIGISQLAKLKPLVLIVDIISFILVFLICLVIIWRKFKKEGTMRTNLNNIGANKATLIKLDSVYVGVFIIIYIINCLCVIGGLILFNMSDYFRENVGYVFISLAFVHFIMLLMYYLSLFMNIIHVKRSE